MREERFDVFGLGQCSLDYIGQVEAYPPPDVKCELSDLVIQGGGPVATALVALSRWGLSCTFAGVVGDDAFGTAIRESMETEGVDCRGLLQRTGAGSQSAFIVAEPGIGRRTIFWRRPTGAPLRLGELDNGLLSRARVLHTDGLFTDTAIGAAISARRNGVQVVVDAGTLRSGMLELARFSDHFLASETFARALMGEDDPLDACRRLAELGPRVVAVTLGSKGYVALSEGRAIEGSAYPVEAVDTTGCGDVFHAGYIYGLTQGWHVERTLDVAAWVAAGVSLRLGGRSGIPSLAEIRARLA